MKGDKTEDKITSNLNLSIGDSRFIVSFYFIASSMMIFGTNTCTCTIFPFEYYVILCYFILSDVMLLIA